MVKTQNTFHFPEGFDDGHWLDTSYCDTQFNVGEKIIIEGEPQIFVVVDVQNQFRRMDRNEAGQALKMIMRNVILECFEEDR